MSDDIEWIRKKANDPKWVLEDISHKRDEIKAEEAKGDRANQSKLRRLRHELARAEAHHERLERKK
ncbi:MAG: hypothetical protein WA021_05730 [Minisyncoccia bacterium]